MLRRIIVTAMAVCIVAMLLVSQSFSAAGGAGGGGRGGRGQRPQREGAGQMQRDPAEMQRMMTERMKAQIGATDEQWKDIQPRLQKVMNLSRQLNAPGRGMMFAGRRQPGGPGTADQGAGQRTRPGTGRAQTEQSAVGKATEELREVLRNEEATSEQIKTKLTALRTAKEKAQKELETAQKDLKQKLTVKQEAFLVLSGYLN